MTTIAATHTAAFRRALKIDEITQDGDAPGIALVGMYDAAVGCYLLNPAELTAIGESQGRSIEELVFDDDSRLLFADDGYSTTMCLVLRGDTRKKLDMARTSQCRMCGRDDRKLTRRGICSPCHFGEV